MYYSLHKLIQILPCVVYTSLYYIYYFVHTSDSGIYINYIGILKLCQKILKNAFSGSGRKHQCAYFIGFAG